MKNNILVHDPQDDVGVAVADLASGDMVGILTLEGESVGQVRLIEDVPLGHKVALHKLPVEKHVIEYGRPIGVAAQAIAAGAHVHVHNLKSLRWAGKDQIVRRQEAS